MNDLSLKGKIVYLVNNEEKIKELKFETNDNKRIHIKLLIKLTDSENIIGEIYSYNYNSIDGYIYVNLSLQEEFMKEQFLHESIKMFFNYLFTCFPIRKIYYETYGNLLNKGIINNLKKIKFNLEANLKKDNFFDGEYHNRYILALYREDFFEEN